MSNYVWTTQNRFYVAAETQYGNPAAIQSANRFQASHLQCHQSVAVSKRRDKTGARTYLGSSSSAPRTSSFEVSASLTSWDVAMGPGCAPLIQAAMGASAELIQGLVVAAADGAQIQTELPHNLNIGFAIGSGGEIRFVTAVQDQYTLTVSAPFSVTPIMGGTLSTTSCYKLGTQLPSISIYDYWDPASAVSRLLTGAGVDTFQIDVSGDVHELKFVGPAADILDSASNSWGVSGLSAFPLEPALFDFDYSIVPGQLGQVWLGSPLNKVFTLTAASIEIKNNLLTRNREFGSSYPMAIVPGPREVLASFTLFAQADANITAIYAAAKTRMPIAAMLQLGTQSGQMMAIFLPKVVPEMPLFDGSEPYLLWEFKNDIAQGVTNDEVSVAFG